jgi:hypothetical protein
VGCEKPSGSAPAVALAELTNSPAKYDGKLVRTDGVWFNAFEFSVLRLTKDSWPTADNSRDVWLDLDDEYLAPDNLPMVKRFVTEFSHWEKGTTIVKIHVEVEGVFRHKDNIWGRESGTTIGFGHMNSFNNEFRVKRLLSYKLAELQK